MSAPDRTGRARWSWASEPWTGRSLRMLAFVDVLAVMVVTVAAYQVGGRDTVQSQLGWFEIGIAGLLLAGIGQCRWLLDGLRAVRTARAIVLPGRGPGTESPRSDARAADGLVAAETMTRFHRPECSFTAGRPVAYASLAAHQHAGRRACEICLPQEI